MKNPVTTISGIIMIILSGLALFGVIGPEQQATIGQYAMEIMTAIVGLIAVFKAGDKGGV